MRVVKKIDYHFFWVKRATDCGLEVSYKTSYFDGSMMLYEPLFQQINIWKMSWKDVEC